MTKVTKVYKNRYMTDRDMGMALTSVMKDKSYILYKLYCSILSTR